MLLAALTETRSTHEPERHFARHQRNSQKEHGCGATVVVISCDGELLTSAPSTVAREMLPVRTALTIVVTIMIN